MGAELSALEKCAREVENLALEFSGEGVRILERCKYEFGNPIVGIFNLNHCEVHLITDEKSTRAACEILKSKDILYIDCEGRYFGSIYSKVGVVQIAVSESCCYLFDVITFPDAFTYLKPILESKTIGKVFHDCSGDIAALHREEEEIMVDLPIVDTQLTQVLVDKCTGEGIMHSLPELFERLLKTKFPTVKVKSKCTENKWIDYRPLTEDMLKYAAIDVLTLPLILQEQKRRRFFAYDQDYKICIERRRFSKIPQNNRRGFYEISGSTRMFNESRNSMCRAVGSRSRSVAEEQTQSQSSSSLDIGTAIAAGAIALAGGILLVQKLSEAERRK